MRTATGDKICELLRAHVGRAHSIHAHQIGEQLRPKMNERTVRQIISDQSCLWHELVCATPGGGYFIAENVEEMLVYRNWLKDQADHWGRKLTRFDTLCKRMGLHLKELAA
jgi:hypothetical protein